MDKKQLILIWLTTLPKVWFTQNEINSVIIDTSQQAIDVIKQDYKEKWINYITFEEAKNFQNMPLIEIKENKLSNKEELEKTQENLINEKEESTIENITKKVIEELHDEILWTAIWRKSTIIIPVWWKGTVPIINKYRDTETEEKYRNLRWDIKYNQEKSVIESRWNETKIEKICSNWIIKIEWLDFDIPIKEWIRLLNFKNWIKYMEKTARKGQKPIIIYKEWLKNTFFNRWLKLINSNTLRKYCPTILKDKTAMEEIAKRLNE